MPWYGYNFEDAIIISEKLIKQDAYTSIYIEEFELTARDTKLGKEEITRDIPNVSEEVLANLGEDGIIRIGAEVKPGDILVGKITPKSETELAPEERLLRAIFGEKAADVKDASLTVPPGTEGVVMDVKVFSRKDRLSKSDDELVEEAVHLKDLQKGYKNQISVLKTEYREKLGALLLNEKAPASIIHRRTADILVQEGIVFDQETIELLEQESLVDLLMPPCDMYDVLKSLLSDYETSLQRLEVNYKTEVEHIREGDADLDHGVIRQVKVYVASKRKLQVGDKMAGRHGNKGLFLRLFLKLICHTLLTAKLYR